MIFDWVFEITRPRSIIFTNRNQLDLKHRILVIASTANVESWPRFTEICSLSLFLSHQLNHHCLSGLFWPLWYFGSHYLRYRQGNYPKISEKKQGPLVNYPTLNDLIFLYLRDKKTMSFKQKKRNKNENEIAMECYATPIRGM